MNKNSSSESYAAAGVDITAGYRAVELMKSHIARTMTAGVCSDIGGFGGLFELDTDRHRAPGAGQRHRRRRHEAEARLPHGQARHRRHRLRGHVRQRHHLLRREAPVSSWTTSPAARTSPSASPSIVSGVAEGCVQSGCGAHRRRDGGDARLLPRGRVRPRGLCRGRRRQGEDPRQDDACAPATS